LSVAAGPGPRSTRTCAGQREPAPAPCFPLSGDEGIRLGDAPRIKEKLQKSLEKVLGPTFEVTSVVAAAGVQAQVDAEGTKNPVAREVASLREQIEALVGIIKGGGDERNEQRFRNVMRLIMAKPAQSNAGRIIDDGELFRAAQADFDAWLATNPEPPPQ
jgi:hypothetical protein